MFSSLKLHFPHSIELRELEQKLKAAYMNKERAAQIAERDAIKYEQMVKLLWVCAQPGSKSRASAKNPLGQVPPTETFRP